MPYFNVITYAHTTRKKQHTKFYCRLAQSSQIRRLNHANNAKLAMTWQCHIMHIHTIYSDSAKNNLYYLSTINLPKLLYLIAIQCHFTKCYHHSLMSFQCNKFHFCPASHYCVCLSLFQLPRNGYAECQILMYKLIIFCQ